MGSLEPRALHASRLLESAHARPKEIHPPKVDLCPVMGSLEPQAPLACLLLESTPTGRLFVWLRFSQTSQRGYRLIFLDPRALPTLIIGKETVPSRDLWNLKLHLRVCSSRAHGSNPLALKAQSWLVSRVCVCAPQKPSRLRLFSPLPKKLYAPQAQDMAGFRMFPRLKRLAQSDSSRVSTLTSSRRVLRDTGPRVRPAGVPHTSFSGGTTP